METLSCHAAKRNANQGSNSVKQATESTQQDSGGHPSVQGGMVYTEHLHKAAHTAHPLRPHTEEPNRPVVTSTKTQSTHPTEYHEHQEGVEY